MIELPSERVFQFHPAFARAWWVIQNKTVFGKFGTVLERLDKLDWQGLAVGAEVDTPSEDGFLRVRLEVQENSRYLRFWVYRLFGSTEISKSTFKREPLSIDFDWGANITLDPDSSSKIAGHGQGYLERFELDCERLTVYRGFTRRAQPRVSLPPFNVPMREAKGVEPLIAADPSEFLEAFEETGYAPSFPGKTGDQPVFGIHFLMRELQRGAKTDTWWFEQLKNEACRPGHLYYIPEGKDRYWPVDDDYVDKLVFGGNSGKFHEKSTGYDEQAWFKPSGSSWLAKSQTGSRWKGWDRQHWGLGPLCQVYIWYRDPGLFWLIESLAGTWLLSNPIENKGTAHHVPKNARGHGRSLQAGAHLYFALMAGGSVYLANKVYNRLEGLVSYQARAWSEDGVRLNREGYASAWMHAEWVNGLASCVHILDLSSLVFGSEIASFVVKCFKHWNDEHWAIPYRVTRDGQAISAEPTNGLTEWCLATVQLCRVVTDSAVEKDKCDSILDQWLTNAPVSSNGDVPSRYRWFL